MADRARTGRAVVLSGGGARGAYEVGVLMALLERARPGVPVADLVCGTSVGAITGAWLAAGADEPAEIVRQLAALWDSLALEDVLAFGPGQIASLPRLLWGGGKAAGLFDARKLFSALERQVRWDRISERIAQGRLAALTITATHVATGRPTVFMQRRTPLERSHHLGRQVVVRDTAITAEHVLASAAIPILFPPVAIGGEIYCDGGLRLNTPMGPAIRLGADRVLVTGLPAANEEPEIPPDRYPGASFLLGKVLNAFLLDHVAGDLDELCRINRFLEHGAAICGPQFTERISERATLQGEPAYHTVRAFVVRPSVDLGVVAAEHLEKMRRRVGRLSAARLLLRLVDSGEARGSDLASYLLFDRDYARDLIALGRKDATAAEDQLEGFLT